MNTENYEMANNAIIITGRTIVKFISMMYIIYICIYAFNYKKINAHFNKKVENVEKVVKTLVKVDDSAISPDSSSPDASSPDASEEDDTSSPDASEEDEASSPDASEEHEASSPVASSEAKVASEEEEDVLTLIRPDDSNKVENIDTWYDIEDGKAKYKGEWKNGLPNGKGIKIIHEQESIIDGNFVDGFAEGYGRQLFAKSWEKMVPYYEGEFKRNKWEGKGEYHYGDGDYYKGEWKNSKYHGQGMAYSLYINRTWVGEYYNDKKFKGDWYHGEL